MWSMAPVRGMAARNGDGATPARVGRHRPRRGYDQAVVTVAGQVREYLQYLVVERGLAANTVESYERDLRRYTGHLAARGKEQLSDVITADVAAFAVALRSGDEDHPPLSDSSAGRAVVAVRGLHAFAL